MTASGTAWSLVQHVDPTSLRHRLGLMLDAVVHAPPPALADLSVMDVLERWGEHEARLRSLDEISVSAGAVVADAELLAPLTYPRKVPCAGTNYDDHGEEMATARPDPDAEPFFSLETPTTIVGPHSRTAGDLAPARCDTRTVAGVFPGPHPEQGIRVDPPGRHPGATTADLRSDLEAWHRGGASGRRGTLAGLDASRRTRRVRDEAGRRRRPSLGTPAMVIGDDERPGGVRRGAAVALRDEVA